MACPIMVSHFTMMFLLRSSFRSSIIASNRKALLQAVIAPADRWDNNVPNLHSSRRSVATESQSHDKKNTPPPVLLYQYAICPFCNKTKALLEYAGVEYRAIEVNPLTKYEIKWSTDYKKVPIATINNDIVLKGSDEIIKGLLQQDSVVSLLEQRWANDNALRCSSSDDNDDSKNSTKVAMITLQDFVGGRSVLADLGDDDVDIKSSSEVEEWLRFANDELASLLYPNICRTWSDSYQAFSYVNKIESFSTIQKMSIQILGSVAMYLAASRVKKKRNITDERKALEDALATVASRLEGTDNTFLSGMPEPHLGDLAVYGVLRSIEGLPTHTEVVMGREGPLKDWYLRMQQKVNSRKALHEGK